MKLFGLIVSLAALTGCAVLYPPRPAMGTWAAVQWLPPGTDVVMKRLGWILLVALNGCAPHHVPKPSVPEPVSTTGRRSWRSRAGPLSSSRRTPVTFAADMSGR